MKSNIRTFALATLVAIASLSPALHAQTTRRAVRADIPFSFDCGANHFAHGVYILDVDGQHEMILRTKSAVAMVMDQKSYDPAPAKNSVVIFKKYGDRYFLQQVQIAGAATRVDVIESRAEKQAARELASRGENATLVALALLPMRPLAN